MEADFSGYATKAGLKCSDGRTIMPDAFKHQDTMKVPLVWQHGHSDPENVLGHAILEHRDDGIYAYGFFNSTAKAAHARTLVEHKDITMMSIWANDLIERAKRVLHGAIREVSLVLSGANPGALIENVTIRHGDDSEDVLDEEAIIYTGLTFEHSDIIEDTANDNANKSFKDLIAGMTDEQKKVVEAAIKHATSDTTDSGNKDPDNDGDNDTNDPEDTQDDKTVQDIYDSMSEEQQQVCNYLVGEALASVPGGSAQQDNLGDKNNNAKGNEMKHNVFETGDDTTNKETATLSHSDVKSIIADATKCGSLKEAVENYALAHGIEDMNVLFPEVSLVAAPPEFVSRRMEWVQTLMAGLRKSPFSRIKTLSADITVQEARAKGYITGTLKKEEFFKVAKRITTPTTIYKKQKLDRDDMIDITDFDVVAWLKAEMRIMLDEEIARAVLIGDGRPSDDEDKIDEERIRPVATDHELYVTQVNVNLDDASSNVDEIVDAFNLNRQWYRGTGLPTFFTTETYIAKFLNLKDSLGRRIYGSLDDIKNELRVQDVVPVEVLEEYPTIIGVVFNPVDYMMGATQGGQVSLFDFFDIDYNQYKYLIETRASGALIKPRSAIVLNKVPGEDVVVVPTAPTFDGTNVTIVNQTGVIYRNEDTDAVVNAAGSPYAVADGTTLTIHAEPDSGYYFSSSHTDTWSFTNPG